MVKELSLGLMKMFIPEIIVMMKENNMEKCLGMTELTLKENGIKASNMDVV